MSKKNLTTSSGAQKKTAYTSYRSPQQARSPAADSSSTDFSTSSDDEGTAGVGIPHQLTENSSTISVSDSANVASTSSTNAINADTDDNDNAREENGSSITEELENLQHNFNNLRIETTSLPDNAIFTEEQFREFEDKIAYRDKVVYDLSKLKQENLQNTVNKILIKLFSNEFLKAYSYYGQGLNKITRQTNKNFSELHICSVILEALRKMFGPDIKDEEIIKCIQKYIGEVKRTFRNN